MTWGRRSNRSEAPPGGAAATSRSECLGPDGRSRPSSRFLQVANVVESLKVPIQSRATCAVWLKDGGAAEKRPCIEVANWPGSMCCKRRRTILAMQATECTSGAMTQRQELSDWLQRFRRAGKSTRGARDCLEGVCHAGHPRQWHRAGRARVPTGRLRPLTGLLRREGGPRGIAPRSTRSPAHEHRCLSHARPDRGPAGP